MLLLNKSWCNKDFRITTASSDVKKFSGLSDKLKTIKSKLCKMNTCNGMHDKERKKKRGKCRRGLKIEPFTNKSIRLLKEALP